MPAKVGSVFTDGSNVLDVHGGQPVTIVSVDSVGGSSLTFLGAKVASPERQYTTTTKFAGWPPHGLKAKGVEDAAGKTITPTSKNWHQQPYELLLGYRVNADSLSTRTGVRVVYKVGDKTYQVTMPSLVTTCPTDQDLQACGDKAFKEN